MQCSDFIRKNTERIIVEWEAFARKTIAPARTMNRVALRDHIQGILKSIASDVESPQGGLKEESTKKRDTSYSAAETHGALRWEAGFDITQMIREYSILRASVIKLWTNGRTEADKFEPLDVTRFNDAIDQALTESLAKYTEKQECSRDLFLGIIGHDLRTPLNAILMSAQLLLRARNLDKKQVELTSQIENSAVRLNEMVNDLLDLTRARLGESIPIAVAPMDMGFAAKQAVEELRACNPKYNTVTFEASGNLEGEWDSVRIGQVLSNLIGNAVQYGAPGSPISVKVEEQPPEVVLSVHNEGLPIPPDKITTIFDALIRARSESTAEQAASTNLGLGLYIAKEIVVAHGGKIDVTSSEKEGTTFTARFPRIMCSS